MANQFHELRERLLRAGVAPRHVRRYLRELADHLADLKAEEEHAGRSRADAESAALLRLGGTDSLARAMIEQRQFQSWSARAPWAAFGLGPLALLASAYVVALLILWSGWNIFLPAADTPFGSAAPGPIYRLENLYFQAGRFIYFSAPVFAGWIIALIAARQRIKALWPIVSFVLLALMGANNQVHASRSAVPYGLGHIRMSFTLGASVHDMYGHLLYALVILSLTALPYLVWRWQSTFTEKMTADQLQS